MATSKERERFEAAAQDIWNRMFSFDEPRIIYYTDGNSVKQIADVIAEHCGQSASRPEAPLDELPPFPDPKVIGTYVLKKAEAQPAETDRQTILCGAAQILDTVKQEWGTSWTAWDQSIRDGITRLQMASEVLAERDGKEE